MTTRGARLIASYDDHTRAMVGAALFAFSDELVQMDAEQVARFGLVMIGDATGWMGSEEALDRTQPVEELAEALFERLGDDLAWESELNDG